MRKSVTCFLKYEVYRIMLYDSLTDASEVARISNQSLVIACFHGEMSSDYSGSHLDRSDNESCRVAICISEQPPLRPLLSCRLHVTLKTRVSKGGRASVPELLSIRRKTIR